MHQQSRLRVVALSLGAWCAACGAGAPGPSAPLAPAPVARVAEAPADAPLPGVPVCELGDQVGAPAPWMLVRRAALNQALSNPLLPGIEDLLSSTVVITGYPYLTTETLDRDAAAGWLRDRAGPALRLKELQRHHHVPVLYAVTEGWSREASESGCITFDFHPYAPAGVTDESSQDWLIDVIERE